MTRREIWAALFAVITPLLRPRAAAGAVRWLRGVAAVYRMMDATRTISGIYRTTRRTASVTTAFSGTSLRQPRNRPPRVTREAFGGEARRHETHDVTMEDRKELDRNLWNYINAIANHDDVMHLAEQWGVEGRSLSRSEYENVQHVEECTQCQEAYIVVTEDTTLSCNSDVLKNRIVVEDKTRKPKNELTPNPGSTIPP